MKKTFPRVRELLQAEVSKFNSVNKVSIKTGLTNNTIGKYLEGISEPQQETLEKLSEYFKKPVAWLRGETDDESVKISVGSLASRLGVDPKEVMARLNAIISSETPDTASFTGYVSSAHQTRKIPVVSIAQAGANGFWEDAYELGSGMEMIDCPPQITDPAAIAFKVEGDSMIPRYYPGETVIIDTTKDVMNGNDVIVKLRDGQVMIKQYRRTNGTIILESYNKSEEMIIVSEQDIERCYKVVCRL
ncbi:MAG: helix-turn-helix transcriptional regulator [Deltaproteobacteria bacterium]|nr:helix-turn-helix transcriptional regulator [Deltaproteobacteria bacterium]